MISRYTRRTFSFVATLLVLAACDARAKVEISSRSDSATQEVRPKGLTIELSDSSKRELLPPLSAIDPRSAVAQAKVRERQQTVLEHRAFERGLTCTSYTPVKACSDFLARINADPKLAAAFDFAKQEPTVLVFLSDPGEGCRIKDGYLTVDPSVSNREIIDFIHFGKECKQ